jgi:phage tail sheath protein FI
MAIEYSQPGVYLQELPADPHPIAGVPTSIAAFVGAAPSGPLDAPLRVKSSAEFETQYGVSAQHPLGDAVRHFFLNGGTEAWIARAAPPGAAENPDAQRDALALLDQVQRFNILCLPPLTRDAGVGRATWDAAAAYARARGAIVIVDPPAAWRSAADAQAGIGALVASSDSVFVCFPRLRAPDASGQVVDHAPCGAIAGLMARTDWNLGVWHAASGEAAVIAGVQGPSVVLSDHDVGLLDPLGVNVMRPMRSGPLVAWGARMFVPPPVYAPVRRTQLFIEQSLVASLTWVTFEPNDEPLWKQVRTSVEDFMLGLFKKGAFAGTTPADAFAVRCDRSTMTQTDIDNGRLILEVGFAPLKPAEFVILRIGQTLGG